MKKERKWGFEDYDSLLTSAKKRNETFLTDLLPGSNYRIGKPSKDSYQYIRSTIVALAQNDRQRNDLEKIKGAPVKVSSIIKMGDGRRIAVLMPLKSEFFIQSLKKVYAQVDNAIANREIVNLDV